MSNRRKPNKYRDGNQLRLFVEPVRTNIPVFILFDEYRDIEKIIGSNEDWLEKTLSTVLTQWDYLYDTYVASFDDEIKAAGAIKRKSAEQELLRLKQALRLSMITDLYVERMTYYESLVAAKAIELGVATDNIEYVNDLTHSFFQQPEHDELSKTLRECIQVLANELVDKVTIEEHEHNQPAPR